MISISELNIRHAEPSDYLSIIAVINNWFGGRNVADRLHRLFFTHFRDTSFVIEKDGFLIGFLVGFLSQTYPNEAYIHFVGVHPDYRKQNIGRTLYNLFFDEVKKHNRNTIRCIASPVNKLSIAFHLAMGFEIEPGDAEVDGVQVFRNYDGRGGDRVCFIKNLHIREYMEAMGMV
ncbi:MAG: GNAT family N-acetyltransferase [Firmicutes bacterium]|nr:GNAT family N-acetyltransferase [Bacillota bacterium]